MLSTLNPVSFAERRLGLYAPIRSTLDAAAAKNNNASTKGGGETARKVAAGCASGAFAAALLNPIELLKTRLMADSAAGGGAASGGGGAVRALLRIVSAEGVAGLWKGVTLAMTRSAVLTASQCATYDEVKRSYMRATGSPDGVATHLCVSMLTGVVTTTATNPVAGACARGGATK